MTGSAGDDRSSGGARRHGSSWSRHRLGGLGLGFGGLQRRHPHLCVLGLSHRRGRRRSAGRHLGEHLVQLVARPGRLLHRGAGTGHRAAGGRRRSPQIVVRHLDRADGAGDARACSGCKNDYHYLWLGLLLLGLGSIFFEFASVSYNAMLHQVSTPANIGRVSAFGWSMGYFGGIVLLLICYVGFIAPDVGWFGVTSEDGLNIRMVALFAALWFALSAIPVLLKVPEIPARPGLETGRASSRPTGCCSGISRAVPDESAHRVLPRAPARCSGTAWPRSSRSAPSWPSPSTASTRPTC